MRIVIAGASGFMGRFLAERFLASGDEVLTIGRSQADAVWGDAAGILSVADGADVLLNLAGRSVNCRYGPANRAEILRSRVETTRALGDAVAAAAQPPRLWLNSSTATIYRHAEDRPMSESTGELGTGFSVGVARAWEDAFFERELPATRRVALRTAIVLGDGSALLPLLNLARIGFGGRSSTVRGSARNGASRPVRSTRTARAAAGRSSPGCISTTCMASSGSWSAATTSTGWSTCRRRTRSTASR